MNSRVKVQCVGHVTQTLFSSQRAPCQLGLWSHLMALLDGVPSKLTPAAADRIQFLLAGSGLLAGGPLSSFHMGLSIGQLTTWQLTFLRTSEWEGEQDGSRSLLWPTIGSDIPRYSLPFPLRMRGINTRALIPGSGETWGLLGGCIPHSGTASPHTCPPNPLSKGTILVTTSKSFLRLFPLHPQTELNSTSTKAFSL